VAATAANTTVAAAMTTPAVTTPAAATTVTRFKRSKIQIHCFSTLMKYAG